MRWQVIPLIAASVVACHYETYHAVDSVGGLGVAVTRTAGDSTPLVIVDRPTVIGFFPPASDSGSNDGGYGEGLAHVGFALEDAQKCFGGDSLATVMVIDTAVRLQRPSGVDTIRFPSIDSLSYGAYFVAPGAKPLLVSGPAGPSQLMQAVPERMPGYFHFQACKTQ